MLHGDLYFKGEGQIFWQVFGNIKKHWVLTLFDTGTYHGVADSQTWLSNFHFQGSYLKKKKKNGMITVFHNYFQSCNAQQSQPLPGSGLKARDKVNKHAWAIDLYHFSSFLLCSPSISWRVSSSPFIYTSLMQNFVAEWSNSIHQKSIWVMITEKRISPYPEKLDTGYGPIG